MKDLASEARAEVAAASRGIGVGLVIAIIGFYVLSAMPQTGADVFGRTIALHAVSLALALLYGGYLVMRRRLPTSTPLHWPIVLLLASYLLSTAASIDARVSAESTLRILLPVMIFAAVADLGFLSRKDLQRGLMLIGGVASLSALWIVAGDYLDWLSFARSVEGGFRVGDLIPPTVLRVHGVSDHPNILAMTLVLILPFYVIAMYRSEWTWERTAAAVGLMAAALTIFLTLSRGAWLGAAAGLGVTVALLALHRYYNSGRAAFRMVSALRRRRAWLVAGSFAAVVVLAVVSIAAASRWESRPLWLFRQSLSPRYDTLTAGRDMFRDHLVLGAGPGTYGLLYPSYSGDFPVFGFHAHNGYVQAAVELGVVGLAVLAVGGGALGWVVWHRYRHGNPEQELVAVACAGSVAGFLVHNMGDAANVWKAPLAVLAVVAAIAVKNHAETERQSVGRSAPHALARAWERLLPSLRALPRAVFAIAFAALFLTWGWLDAAHFHYSRSLDAARAGRIDDAVRLGQRAADIDPSLTVYQLNLGENEFLASENGADRQLLDDSIRHLRRAVDLDQRSAVAHANLARVLAAKGEQEEAEAVAIRASDLAGADATLLIAAGTILEQLEADQEAVTTYAAAISADFSLVDSTFWAATEFRSLHYADIIGESSAAFSPCRLGSLLARSSDQALAETAGDLEDLRERCAATVSAGPDRLIRRVHLAEILMALGNYDEAWAHLSFVKERQPDLGPARTALGRWYAAQGDLGAARREWLLAGQLSQPEALVLLGDTYLPGEVPEGVVARLDQLAPVVAGGARRHGAANVYYRMKFGREPPRTVLIPGEWQSALPGEYTMVQEALARWRAVPVQPGNR